jgi:hypothetical protein
MKTELKVKVNGKEAVRFFRNAEDESNLLKEAIKSLISNSYISNNKLVVLSESEVAIRNPQRKVLTEYLEVRDNYAILPSDEIKEIAKAVSVNSGESISSSISTLLSDEETMIKEKLAFQLPVSIEKNLIKEKVFEISFVEAIIDGKHVKGTGESYWIERDE